jgi:hypothetical protein
MLAFVCISSESTCAEDEEFMQAGKAIFVGRPIRFWFLQHPLLNSLALPVIMCAITLVEGCARPPNFDLKQIC